MYTFDFFDPWDYVTSDNTASDSSDTSAFSYPATYPCSVAFRGWVHLFCTSAEQPVTVDKAWLQGLLDRNPLRLSREYQVPLLCNQWGVKRSVTESRGRLRYAEDVASLLGASGIHSALWIWRSCEEKEVGSRQWEVGSRQ